MFSTKYSFNKKEVANFFFSRTPDWFDTYVLGREVLRPDGSVWGVAKTGRQRVYTLADIEIIAMHLVSAGSISLEKFADIINALKMLSSIWEKDGHHA